MREGKKAQAVKKTESDKFRYSVYISHELNENFKSAWQTQNIGTQNDAVIEAIKFYIENISDQVGTRKNWNYMMEQKLEIKTSHVITVISYYLSLMLRLMLLCFGNILQNQETILEALSQDYQAETISQEKLLTTAINETPTIYQPVRLSVTKMMADKKDGEKKNAPQKPSTKPN